MIKIKNRQGELEELDITKIQKNTSKAVKGLNNVSQSELEAEAHLVFTNGMTTREIQDTLVKTAVEKIDIDRPDWTFVAARLFLYNLYHNVGIRINNEKGNAYGSFKSYLEYGEKQGKIVLGLKEKFNLDELEKAIDPERDFQFNFLGIRTLFDRYLLKDKEGYTFELPQQLFMGVCMFISQNEINPISMSEEARKEYSSLKLDDKEQKQFVRTYWAKKFYDIVSKFEVMLATPTLSNARTPRHQLSSCFTKGTKVRTIDGYKDIDKIELGDMVLTHNNRFMRVYELFERDFARNLISLDINGLIDDLKATEEHPVLSIKKENVKCIRKLGNCIISQAKNNRCFKMKGEYKNDCELLNKEFKSEWNKIEDLNKGDFVSISYPKNIHKDKIFISDYVNTKNIIELDKQIMFKRSSNSFYSVERSFLNNQINPVNNEIKLTKDFMLMIGYFLAEGHISKDLTKITFTFGSKEKKYIEETKNILEKVFGVTVFIKENKDNSTNVSVYNKIVALFFNELVGTGFNKKKLNNDILFANPEVQEYLLIGAIRGDGCALEEGYQLTMSNKELINQLFEISLRCGLSPYMRRDKNKHKLATIKASHLKIGSKVNKDFILKVDKNIDKINFEQKSSTTLRYFWFNNEYFMKIVDREDNYLEDKVYNIEVEEDHSYSVSNVNVHNCYIGSTPDNIEGIFDSYKEQALLSKFGGGIGWDWMKVRGSSSAIDNNKGAAGGIVPFLKIDNDIAVAVDQLGTRRGAIAVYIEPWHIDVESFLDLKKTSGEERRRAHDLFPAMWLNDLFMERAENDEAWTLFSPNDVPELTECYGEEFNKKYLEYEMDETIPKKIISAKLLWKIILKEYFETGSPFLTFKDRANAVNPNKHNGIIRSTNLCTEIFQNTAPSEYQVEIEFKDGSTVVYKEEDIVKTDEGLNKPAKKITTLDTLGGKEIFFVSKKSIDGTGDTAVCNLASVNLSKVNTKEDMERVVPIAGRMLDNVIDLNFYPSRKTKVTNQKTRAVGLGVMGEAQMLAEAKIMFGSQEHFDKIDKVMEIFSYNMIKSSSNLATEKGKYPLYKGSEWSKGVFPMDNAKETVLELTTRESLVYDWDELREKVKKDGMRNGYLMAVAPTSSISILTGTTQAIEPVFKRKFYEENLSGVIPVTVPNLNSETWQYYVTAYELNQNLLVKAGAVRQKWLDQGQSLNIFMMVDKVSGKVLNEIYMNAWKYGLKSTYYLRSQSPEAKEDEVEDRSMECVGCQ